MALSALLLAPTAVPTAMCTAAPTGHPKTTRGRRTPQRLPGLVLSNGQRLGPNYLVFHNATYRLIERLDASMTHDEWNATMQQILNRVWNLNQVRYRYAQLGNEEMVENLQEEIWDILFYLLDHLTFRCQTGYRLNFNDMIVVLYYASGGDITEAMIRQGDHEQYIAQGRITDDQLMEWAERQLNPHSYQFALVALRALWYDTQLHQAEWETNVPHFLMDALSHSVGLRQALVDACLPRLATRHGRSQYVDEYHDPLMSRVSPGNSIDETIRDRNIYERQFWNGLLGNQQG